MGVLCGARSILHINEKAGRFAGTEEYIANLTKLLSPLGIDSHLIYDQVHGEIPSLIRSRRRIAGLGDRDARQDVSRPVFQMVSRINPDVVYIHNIFDGRVIQALDTPERKYVILWYVHDHYPTCLTELRARTERSEIICLEPLSEACLSNIDAGYCRKRYADRSYNHVDLLSRSYLLKSARGVDAIIVVSDFMREILVKNLPDIKPKIHVLPRQVRPPRETNRRKNGKMRVVLFSGRISYEKGLHTVMEALSRVRLKSDILCQIAGPIEDRGYWSHCRQLAKDAELRNPSLKIRYEGFLSYEDIDSLYSKADVTVVPSLWGEPLGAVAAEALINGSAVVAYDVGGISTWVKHGKTGLLIMPNDVFALSRGLEELLSDENLRRRLAVSGKQLIRQRFNPEQHLKALAGVIGRSRSWRETHSGS